MKGIINSSIIVIILIVGQAAFGQTFHSGDIARIKSAINTAGSGKCMDVAGGYLFDGNAIVQFDCHNGSNQRFQMQRVTLRGDFIIESTVDQSKCVGIADNVHANAYELLRVEPCRDSNNDVPLGVRFRLDVNAAGQTRFRAISPSWDGQQTCIDIASGSNANSLWLQLYYCHDGSNQRWISN